MIGTGLTPEGIEQNDMMYELMNEMGYYCIGYNHQSVFVRRPTLRIAPHIWYEPEDVFKAWDALVAVAEDFSHSETFR